MASLTDSLNIRILVTGASGYLGSSFIKEFNSEYRIETLQLRNPGWENASLQGVDCILHCAALVHQMNGAPVKDYFRVNTDLTQRLAEKARIDGVKHFVYISSAHVYGDSTPNGVVIKETSAPNPVDAYGASKLAAEDILMKMNSPSFAVSIVRSPLIYGKNSKGNLNSLARLIQICPALPFKFNKNKRSFIYIKNLTQFIDKIISQKKEGIFLPQDAHPLSLEDLVRLMSLACEKKVLLFKPPIFLLWTLEKTAPKIYRRLFSSLAFNSESTNGALNYQPRYTTEEGLRDMFQR